MGKERNRNTIYMNKAFSGLVDTMGDKIKLVMKQRMIEDCLQALNWITIE